MKTFTKDPDAQLDFSEDWSDWLTPINDTIASTVWEVADGLTVVDDDFNATSVTVWLAGGMAGQSYKLTCRITTAHVPPRIDDRSFMVNCQER